MLESHDFLPGCKEQAFTDAAVAACADGSGVIENPAACRWNPFRLVGEVTPCGPITAFEHDGGKILIWAHPRGTREALPPAPARVRLIQAADSRIRSG